MGATPVQTRMWAVGWTIGLVAMPAAAPRVAVAARPLHIKSWNRGTPVPLRMYLTPRHLKLHVQM